MNWSTYDRIGTFITSALLFAYFGFGGLAQAENSLTIIAGNGQAGFRDGADSQFNKPIRLAPFGDGKIVVADFNNNAIRVVDRNGVVSTIAGGAGKTGHRDGAAEEAMFNGPHGVAVSAQGVIAVADISNHLVRLITPIRLPGEMVRYEVSTAAGVHDNRGMQDGAADQALFNSPSAVAWDKEGGLLVVDIGNARIRRIKDDIVTTILGPEGIGVPIDISLTTDQEMLLANTGNNTVVRQRSDGQLETVKMSGTLDVPHGVSADVARNVYVAEISGHRVVKILPNGDMTIVAGTGIAGGGSDELNRPAAVLAHDGLIWIADLENHRISVLSIVF